MERQSYAAAKLGLLAGTVIGIAIGVFGARWLGWRYASPATLESLTASSPDAPPAAADASAAHASDRPLIQGTRAEEPAIDAGEIPSTAAEVEALRLRVAELEDELARLRLALADRAARARLRRAALQGRGLRHEALEADLLELFFDPETLVENPSIAFDLLLRASDESGIVSHLTQGSDVERNAGWQLELEEEPFDGKFAVFVQREHNTYSFNEQILEVDVERWILDLSMPTLPTVIAEQRLDMSAGQLSVELEWRSNDTWTMSLVLDGRGTTGARAEVSIEWDFVGGYSLQREALGWSDSKPVSPAELAPLFTELRQFRERLQRRFR